MGNAEARIQAAVKVISQYGGIDGGHHKAWVLDQALRSLLGDVGYVEWRAEWEQGGEYEWDEGIAP